MPDTPESSLLQPNGGERSKAVRGRSERLRDVGVCLAIGVAVMSLLALSGAIGWVEAATASVVLALAIGAYLTATSGERAEPKAEPQPEPQKIDWTPERNAMRALIDGMEQAVIVVDHRMRAVLSNDVARGVLNMAPNTAPPMSSISRRPELLRLVERCISYRQSGAVEIKISGPADQSLMARVAPLTVEGESGALIVFEDMTAMRRTERARADFLANASHELRTPLTALAGYIETMRGSAKDDVASWDRFLEIMYGQTERMRRLIDDLQSLSSIEHREHSVPESLVDLALIAQEAAEALTPHAERHKRKINYSGPKEGVLVIGSRDELVQVAQNLIDNALKYSPEGGIVTVAVGSGSDADAARLSSGRQWGDADRITIVKSRDVPGRAFAWMRVSDEGAGIPVESLPRLGERFYRVDESRGGKITGTGLGLAIVKHIMTRHRGGLNVESVFGRGTAFGVWLAQPEPSVAALARAAE